MDRAEILKEEEGSTGRVEQEESSATSWNSNTHSHTHSLISSVPNFLNSYCCSLPFFHVLQPHSFHLPIRNSPPFIPPFHLLPSLPLANAGCVLCRFLNRCHQEQLSVPKEWLEIQRNKTIIQQHFDIYLHYLLPTPSLGTLQNL